MQRFKKLSRHVVVRSVCTHVVICKNGDNTSCKQNGKYDGQEHEELQQHTTHHAHVETFLQTLKATELHH